MTRACYLNLIGPASLIFGLVFVSRDFELHWWYAFGTEESTVVLVFIL